MRFITVALIALMAIVMAVGIAGALNPSTITISGCGDLADGLLFGPYNAEGYSVVPQATDTPSAVLKGVIVVNDDGSFYYDGIPPADLKKIGLKYQVLTPDGRTEGHVVSIKVTPCAKEPPESVACDGLLLEITQPADGQVFDAGEKIEVRIRLMTGSGDYKTKFYLDGVKSKSAFSILEPGTHELTVRASSADASCASKESVLITVV